MRLADSSSRLPNRWPVSIGDEKRLASSLFEMILVYLEIFWTRFASHFIKLFQIEMRPIMSHFEIILNLRHVWYNLKFKLSQT